MNYTPSTPVNDFGLPYNVVLAEYHAPADLVRSGPWLFNHTLA